MFVFVFLFFLKKGLPFYDLTAYIKKTSNMAVDSSFTSTPEKTTLRRRGCIILQISSVCVKILITT